MCIRTAAGVISRSTSAAQELEETTAMFRHPFFLLLACLLLAPLSACGPTDDDDSDPPDDAGTDHEDTTVGDSSDAPAFALNWPIFEPPHDPLQGSNVESCPILGATMCVGATQRQCAIYDVDHGRFEDAPDAMQERAYLYDRWYDLYASPDGQTAERLYRQAMPPGTPESVWGDPANLAGWAGAGDSAIWTGTALNSFVLRYLHTGTEADYRRMEEKTRVMLRFFEVTGIPGYLARYHFLQVPPGTPNSPDHIFQSRETDDDVRDIPNPESLGFLPDAYFAGPNVVPRWSGDPSIDQMNGPMVAFPMVHGLLRDAALQERIAYQMTCYLHRLRRIEIRNLQDDPELRSTITQLFGSAQVTLDPGDVDPTTVDTLVLYVHPQINTSNEDDYDTTCGDFIQTEPWRVIDTADASFVLDLIALAQDMSRSENGPNQVNHFYIPSIRGGDAAHMMHLVLMAYAFTDDERYADFLRDELLGRIGTAEIASIMGATVMPQFCRRFYGTNIIAGPLWALNNLLADSKLDRHMQLVMREEMWQKECHDIGNINFNLMFAGAVSEVIGGADRAEALRYALDVLPQFGGNGGVLADPRRVYRRSFDEVVAALPEGTTTRCPTEDERALCEYELTLFGFPITSEQISFPCTGGSEECLMEDGLCTHAEASAPLPPDLRRWADYTWQRNPFELGDDRTDGTRQSAGTDYTEQYWMARFYDFLGGDLEVLAWRDTGAPCE